ncbi:YbgA family protein [Atopococcus tabaci]|uniref:YbgA family protein n=1 Tax=Atopococcus tabaci TaxID=269774 RepID=UPI00041B5DD9|nr:YbgA family protein [Atopococcus tabaci]
MEGKDIDIMLEVKDKNLSTIKCINATQPQRGIQALEKEWARYKYVVLEHSHTLYNDIRQLLKDKKAYPVKEFYASIQRALEQDVEKGQAVNAAQHVWGYFKDIADDKEVRAFQRNLQKFQDGNLKHATFKRQMQRLAEKYEIPYLKQSLYFEL